MSRVGRAQGGLTRKQLLGTGASAAAAALLAQSGGIERALAAAKGKRRDVAGMNIVLFLTDQERAIQHFPPNWLRQNLPGMRRLRRTALSFERAFTNACMCSPARSTLMSGYFPAQHGVKYTLEEDMPASEYPQVELPTDLPNLATVMKAAGYNVVYKGKWHCSKPAGAEARCPPTSKSTASCAGTRPTPAPTRASPRRAAASSTTTAASSNRRAARSGYRGGAAVPQLDRGPAAALLHGDLGRQPARRPLLPEHHLRRSRLRRLLAAGEHRPARDRRRRPLDQAHRSRNSSCGSSTSPGSRRPKSRSATT